MSINKDQMFDVVEYISALDAVEKVIEDRPFDYDWGDGMRATLPKVIEIQSDLGYQREILGYLIRSDSGWRFSTTKDGDT